MTAIVEQKIMTSLHEATSLYKLLFLERYHQMRALFICTALKSMLSI